jgi:hypothetical protein
MVGELQLIFSPLCFCGPGSSVDIANGYGLDGPGIKSRWGRDFSHTSRPALWPTQPPVQWIPGLSRGVNWPGRGADHPPPPSAEVESTAILYSPSGPFVACYRMTFTFTLCVSIFIHGFNLPSDIYF